MQSGRGRLDLRADTRTTATPYAHGPRVRLGAILATGWPWLDSVVSIAIVATIMYGACGLAHNSLVLMLREVLQGVERALVPGRLADVVGRAAGPQRIAEWVIVVSNLFADNRTFMRSAAVAIWIVLFGWSLFGATSIALAHGSDAHEQERPRASQAINSRTHDEQIPKPTDDGISGHELTNSETALSLSTVVQDLTLVDFPTLHPLVVHVPVTFIPAAFVFAVLSLFFPQRALTWLALAFSLVGLFGGFVAAFPLHPHATGLPVAAAATLEKHEFFAFATLALGLVAVLAALIAIWRPRRLPKFVLSVLLLIAAACVAIAGHYGGTLAYVHGVGVKGKYLSSH